MTTSVSIHEVMANPDRYIGRKFNIDVDGELLETNNDENVLGTFMAIDLSSTRIPLEYIIRYTDGEETALTVDQTSNVFFKFNNDPRGGRRKSRKSKSRKSKSRKSKSRKSRKRILF